jgi:hypothetical protein
MDGADLRDAWLSGASLVRATLRHARLQQARLDGANLEGAILAKANLCGARHDLRTHWPKDLDPRAYGAILVTRPADGGRR